MALVIHGFRICSKQEYNIRVRTYTVNNQNCYIHVLKEGWTYLASVMDLCSRKIIGYAYGTSMTAGLAVQTVKNACLNVKETEGIILPSDLGSQYTSQAFEGYLNKKKMLHSFSRKGTPYDNACIESWYNRKRIHSAINYMSPQQKEEDELKKAT